MSGPFGELREEELAPALSPSTTGRVILLASVFVVAACGLAYELVAGAVSSYLMGDAVTQFSLVIGVFLSSMGLGSFLAKFVRRRLLHTFVHLEIWIGLLGGLSSMAMMAAYALVPELFVPFFYLLCASIGALVGVEIPLLVRIVRSGGGISEALSHVLALDYLGALAGAVLFPLVALPHLGLSRASVVFGILNLAVAVVGVGLLRGSRRGLLLGLAASWVVLVAALVTSGRLVGFLEDLIYQDSVIFARDTAYQRIVLTRWRDDVRLYLNGHIQLSSVDEHRYHEPLVIPAMELVRRPRRVLVLGGGDGMAVREVLKYPGVEAVTLVDIDPVMTELARTRPVLSRLNRGSLDDPRVEVVNTDAMRFLAEDDRLWDVILCDLPDPSSASLAKLYSRAFYGLALRRLAAGAALATHATSPFYAREAFWCIVATLEGAGSGEAGTPTLEVTPYHAHVPSFGEWGFALATFEAVSIEGLEPSVPTRFLDADALAAMAAFGRDIERPAGVEVNRLDDPVLFRYYQQGWRTYNE